MINNKPCVVWTLPLLLTYSMCGQSSDLRSRMRFTITFSLSLPDVSSLILAALVPLGTAVALLAATMNQSKLTDMVVQQPYGHGVGKNGQQIWSILFAMQTIPQLYSMHNWFDTSSGVLHVQRVILKAAQRTCLKR